MLSDYINLLARYGFLIEQLEEPIWQGHPIVFGLRAKKT
jgi:hypothetical protein